jgi:prevent-host-death family protein
MKVFTASEARANLFRLIDQAAEQHVPVLITSKRHNAVLLSEQDWQAVQETIYLLSIPGMRESIRQGLGTPTEELLSEAEFLAELAASAEPAEDEGEALP